VSREAELERARAEYRARDAAADTPYRWDNPGYVLYVQSVERAMLRAFDDAGVELTGARVLDVGSGSGYFLHRLREYGAGECVGIDLLEERVAAARERYPVLDLHVGDAAELPFANGSFDLVTQFTCLSSIVDDDTRLAAAREMLRVAAGGWVLSFDMRGARALGRRQPPNATQTVPLTGGELRRLFGEPSLLRRAGLRFDLAQVVGRHALLASGLAELRPLRGSLLGLWRVPPDQGRSDL
jgi:SAM-dependent methyltransferase